MNPNDLKETNHSSNGISPFVKWVGGKRGILNVLVQNLPEFYKGYYEPFIGGGALFWKLQPQKAVISDVNIDLIITYKVIQKKPLELIDSLKYHKENHNKTYYYKVRNKDVITSPVEVASRFIYLNKTCFNGLYRENSKGKFNVPFGKYANPLILDDIGIMACHKVLQTTTIKNEDFTSCKPNKNDFVYLDPPYHKTYSGYSDKGFSIDRHIELADFCKALNKDGVYFMLSNSATDEIKGLYKSFNIVNVEAPRRVSCKAQSRQNISEFLIKNY